MDNANRDGYCSPLSYGHPGTTLPCTWGKKMVIETTGKQHLGMNYVRRCCFCSEEAWEGNGMYSETSVLLLSPASTVQRSYHEDVAKILGR